MPSANISTVERTTMRLLKQLRQDEVQDIKDSLIEITADGVISEDEKVDLAEILMNTLTNFTRRRGAEVIGSKVLNGGR